MSSPQQDSVDRTPSSNRNVKEVSMDSDMTATEQKAEERNVTHDIVNSQQRSTAGIENVVEEHMTVSREEYDSDALVYDATENSNKVVDKRPVGGQLNISTKPALLALAPRGVIDNNEGRKCCIYCCRHEKNISRSTIYDVCSDIRQLHLCKCQFVARNDYGCVARLIFEELEGFDTSCKLTRNGLHSRFQTEFDNAVHMPLTDTETMLRKLWLKSFEQSEADAEDKADEIKTCISRLNDHRMYCQHYPRSHKCCWDDGYITIPGSFELYWWKNDSTTMRETSAEVQSTSYNVDSTEDGICKEIHRIETAAMSARYKYLSQFIPCPAKLVKLRRMLLPMIAQCVQVRTVCGKQVIEQSGPYLPLNISLFDLWLQHGPTRHDAIRLLLQCSMTIPNYYGHERNMLHPILQHGEKYFSTSVRYQQQEIQDLILRALQNVNLTIVSKNWSLHLNKVLTFEALETERFLTTPAVQLPEKLQEPKRIIDVLRADIYDMFDKGEVDTDRVLSDGYVLYSMQGDKLPEDEFLLETYDYNLANKAFPRYFIPGLSRPRFARICEFDNNLDKLETLCSIFFSEDGTLRQQIFNDVQKLKGRNNYITFTNARKGGYSGATADQRWQIGIKPGSTTWWAVQKVVDTLNIINMDKEDIDEIVLIAGGTSDQMIHHDIGRQWSAWDAKKVKRVNVEKNTLGWEVNRLVYNRDMADTFAPATFLIGMHPPTYTVLLGIQRTTIDNISDDQKWCQVRNGIADELFEIVRQSAHLVTIKANVGFAFTGDFQHAGVRNVDHNDVRAPLLPLLFASIESILEDSHPVQPRDVQILNMLSRFGGLRGLCRLHIGTRRKGSNIVVPSGMVAYHECINAQEEADV